MEWSKEADDAVSKVPFFVRGRVRKKVEEEAGRLGARVVTFDHVRSCRERFLRNMEDEVKGYSVETCFGPGGCPNRACESEALVSEIESRLARADIKLFLKERVQGPLKMHHEFRVSVSDCPNACSRPQIVDIGVLGARRPNVSDDPCAQCGACVDTCKEGAILLSDQTTGPEIDFDQCLSCGACIEVCPSGTLVESQRGFRILVGGKLGRHPRLATDLGGFFSLEEALQAIDGCLMYYLTHNSAGERFGEILDRVGFGDFAAYCSSHEHKEVRDEKA